MTFAQGDETSVSSNSPFQYYTHPDDHTRWSKFNLDQNECKSLQVYKSTGQTESQVVGAMCLLASLFGQGLLGYDFTWTFNIHEVAVWALNKPLKFVLSFFFLHRGMQKIFEQLETIQTELGKQLNIYMALKAA